jgi:hypothetical protein
MKTLRVTVVIVAMLLYWGGPVVSQSACRGSSEASGEATDLTAILHRAPGT